MAVQFDIIIVGTALNSFGLTGKNTISGLGLNTFGFLWDCADIWGPAYDTVVTTWTNCLDPNANIETCSD